MITKAQKSTAVPCELRHAQVQLCAAVLPIWGRLLATSQAQSETAVAEMLSAFTEMTPFLNVLDRKFSNDPASSKGDRESLNLLIERMYVGFQYQDRISQMLALVLAEITRLQQALQDPPTSIATLDIDPWLDRMKSQYAMAEQRRDHQDASGGQQIEQASEETTVF